MIRFTVDLDEADERIDKLLARRLPDHSRATLQRWIGEGLVSIDGRPCRAKDRAKPGAIVELTPGSAPISSAGPEPDVVFDVVYEDEHLLVIDKPPGLVVHPARGHRSGTLVNGLLSRPGFEPPPSDPADASGLLRPGIVHRIDKGTSGLLVVAKNERAREGLKAQLSSHSVQRLYSALTVGVPREGVIGTWYGRHPRSRLRFSSRLERGRRAVTHVRVAEVFGAGRAALVSCRLETGRTHQIRVHLFEQARTPLLGDPLYGGPPADPELARIGRALGRQALHAGLLAFTHPVTAEPLRFEREPPKDFQDALQALRALGAAAAGAT